MDRKIILWTIAVFFGSMILFRAIDDAASPSSQGLSLGIQAAVAVAIVVTIIVVQRKRPK